MNRGSKTPLFSILRKLLAASSLAEKSTDEVLLLSRRQFLKGAAAIGSLPLLPIIPGKSFAKDAPRIVIIGAGIAGLNAAYTLKKAGIIAQVYEGSPRLGGRIFTGKNILAQGVTTELGGEFIDSNHQEMLALANEFGLEVKDRKTNNSLIHRAFYFGGSMRTEKEVIEAMKPIIGKIQNDAASIPNYFDADNPGNAAALDAISLAEYFHKLEISGWMKDLLEVAYVTEFGLEASDQSALNFLTMFSSDMSHGFDVFGVSDERFVINGGNIRIIEELSMRHSDTISLEHKLESIRTKGKGFSLTFATNGSVKNIDADIVLLTIPFTILRNIELRVELPHWKEKAIKELGYGNHTKVVSGFTHRLWKENGYAGEVFSDEDFQLCWDNSEMQSAESGGLTSFTGGNKASLAAKDTVDFQSRRFIGNMEKIFPRISKTSNGNAERFAWSLYPFTIGSYSCYKPGQWTTIRGREMKSIGNIFFAGEHCSLEFQGFMNGAAETGKKAAVNIINLLK